MQSLFKKLFIFLLIIVFIIGFSDSYFSLSMDNLAYVLALGIDVGTDNKLEVSFQFSSTIAASESGSSEPAKTMVNTVNASSLSTAINLINGYLGKPINLSHCKVIIISEELAYNGISEEIYTLINDTQLRPSSNIIISKCSAKYYIEQTIPELESLISKYYETFTNSSKYTGYTSDSTIGDFFFALTSKTYEPSAILGGVHMNSSDSDTSANSTNSEEVTNVEKDYSIKANTSSVTGENGAENIGMAVFKSDKLVGELNAIETISYLNVRNEIERFLISVPDPSHVNSYIDIYISPTNSVNIDVEPDDGSPYIKLKFKFDGKIYSMSQNSKYLSTNLIEEISQSCNSYLESVFTEYLYRTSKDLKSDINNFGTHALSKFLTVDEFTEYNWAENYKNAFFDVEVDTSVQSGMLITET